MNAITSTDLLTRIDRLEARAAIAELVGSYGVACDDRDMARLGALFTEDASFSSRDGVMRAKGVPAILEMYRGRFRVLGPSYHWTHDHFVRFDAENADRATGTVLGHAECWRNGEALIGAMRYEDVYRRDGGVWRFASRELAFFYYVPVTEYAEALGSRFRQRAYGDQRPADYPETLATWTTWETVPA